MKTSLAGDGVRIRKLKKADVPAMHKQLQDRNISKYTLTLPFPYSRKNAIEFIEQAEKGWRTKTAYHFAITPDGSDELIGIVSLGKVDQKNKHTEVGYWLGRKYWGKGIVTEAVKLVLQFAFTEVKLHRVAVSNLEENIGSRKVAQKNGFKYEGTFRDEFFRFGRWHSRRWYSILKSEYIKIKKK